MRITELLENLVTEDAMMGKIADSGKIIRILKKAHTCLLYTSDAADE